MEILKLLCKEICFGYDWKDVDPRPQCFGISFVSNCKWIRIKYRTFIDEQFPYEMKSAIIKSFVRS